MVRWHWLGCVVVALLVLGGCGGSKTTPVKVSGTVEVDGKPLDDGSINLLGEAGTPASSFPVKNGKFEGTATPGKKKVEIYAYKQVAPTMMGDKPVEGSDKQNYLPARFNTSTTLTTEVTASGLNPSDFKVQGQ